jgi:hypothetical protein
MSLETDGFLSKDAPWIAKIRAENAARFSLCEKLNQLAVRIGMRELDVVTDTGYADSRIVALLLFYRSTSSFQGTVLLAERGMIVEARTLARSCLETAIHLGALRTDPEHVRNLLNDELFSRKQRAKAILDEPELVSSAAAGRLRAFLDDVEKRGKLSRHSLEQLAKNAGVEGLYLFFRQLSSDAAHPTLSSLNRYVASDPSLNIKGTHCMPKLDHVEIGDTLQLATMSFILACTATVDLFPEPSIQLELSECQSDYERIEAVRSSTENGGKSDVSDR